MTTTKLIKTASGMEVEKDGKKYPVRSEDEMEFTKLALTQGTNWLKSDATFFTCLSQGIEIPSERVKIVPYCDFCGYSVDCSGCRQAPESIKQYAILLPEDKKEEGQEEIIHQVEVSFVKHIYAKVIHGEPHICGMDYFINELKQKFKIERR
jgi:hypothetical protein